VSKESELRNSYSIVPFTPGSCEYRFLRVLKADVMLGHMEERLKCVFRFRQAYTMLTSSAGCRGDSQP
jgi:hypothetical protein